MNLLKKLKRKNGFSLVELLVTITIIGIISAILYSSYSKYVTTAKSSAARAETLEIVEAFEAAMVENSMTGRPTGFTLNANNFTSYLELEELLETETLSNVYQTIQEFSLPNNVTIGLADGIFTYSKNGVTCKFDVVNRNFVSTIIN